jgi:bacterioferritin
MKYYSKKIKAHPILDDESNISVQVSMPEMDDGEDEVAPSIATLLNVALVGEYQQWDLYVAYGNRLKGMARNAVADEFKAHAGEEQAHIELLQRYLVSMGVTPTLQRKPIPELTPEANMRDIVELQLKFEKDAVELYKKILNIIPDNEPLKLDIESVIVMEQEHVHDLELLLKEPTVASVLACQVFRPKEAGEPTKPQAGYGKDEGCDSFLTRVDKAWCTQALKELTPDLYARWHQGKLLTAQEKAFVAQAIALKWNLKDKRAMLRFLDSSRA